MSISEVEKNGAQSPVGYQTMMDVKRNANQLSGAASVTAEED